MGHVFADIELVNSVDLALSKRGEIGNEEVRNHKLNVMVDTGALMMTINENIQEFLGCRRLTIGSHKWRMVRECDFRL